MIDYTKLAQKLRQNMTEAERVFWHQVRNRRFENIKFKRQHKITPYIVDFICEEHNLIIEIDGGQHCDNEKDIERDTFLKSNGYTILRFWNNDLLQNIEGVLMKISNHIHPPSPQPSPQGEGAAIHIGTIRGAHGVKGLVRIAVFADDTSLFDYEPTYKITLKNKHKGNVWLADIDGINNKEDADALKATKLYCDRDQLTPPSDDEIYFADLIGMQCVDEDGTIIGEVTSVDNFGAGDLLDIKPPQGHNFFLSYDDNTVLSIDGKITVRVPEMI